MLNRRWFLGAPAAALLGALVVGSAALAAERTPFTWAAFEAARAEGGPVLVDVYAPWCPTCRQQERIVDALLLERPDFGALKIFVVDYDTGKDIMRSFATTSRATLIAFKGGSEVGRIVFDARPESVEALIAAAF